MSRASVRVDCAACGEEIINEREVYRGGMVLCRGCAGAAYYLPAHESAALRLQPRRGLAVQVAEPNRVNGCLFELAG